MKFKGLLGNVIKTLLINTKVGTPSFHVNMFYQDIKNLLFPYNPGNEDFNVDGACSEVDAAYTLLSKSYDKTWNRDVVYGFVQDVASSLAYKGTSIFEIVEGEKLLDLNDSRRYRLIKLFFFYFKISFGYFPDEEVVELQVVSAKNIFVFTMPSELGTSNDQKRLIMKLERYSSLLPKCFSDDIGSELYQSNFDIVSYREKVDSQVNYLTRKWGWNRRDMGGDNATEYYSIYKAVSFNLAKAYFREKIVLDLNKVLSLFSIDVIIKLNNSITSQELLKIISMLEHDEISLLDAYKKSSSVT